MYKWKIDDYEFKYNPSRLSDSVNIENNESISLSGDFSGYFFRETKSMELETFIYGDKIALEDEVNFLDYFLYGDIDFNIIYLATSGSVHKYDYFNEYSFVGSFNFGSNINGICKDYYNDFLYIMSGNTLYQTDLNGNIFGNIVIYGGAENGRSLTYNRLDNNLYTLDPYGMIYIINYTGNIYSSYYTFNDYSENYTNSYERYFGIKHDGEFFWYFDKKENNLVQIDIDNNDVVNAINLDGLFLKTNFTDVVVRDISSNIFLVNRLFKNIKYNDINYKLYKLLQKLSGGVITITNEFKKQYKGIIKNLSVKEEISDFNRPYYKVSIQVQISP